MGQVVTERGREPVHISEQDVLIVVDVQNDFTRGSMAIAGSSAIIEPINQLAACFPNLVVVTDWHPPGHISFASAHGGRQPGDEVVASYGAQAVFGYGAAYPAQRLPTGVRLLWVLLRERSRDRHGADRVPAGARNTTRVVRRAGPIWLRDALRTGCGP